MESRAFATNSKLWEKKIVPYKKIKNNKKSTRHDMVEILLQLALNTNFSIKVLELFDYTY
jgi:hypothetical protein